MPLPLPRPMRPVEHLSTTMTWPRSSVTANAADARPPPPLPPLPCTVANPMPASDWLNSLLGRRLRGRREGENDPGMGLEEPTA